MTDSTLVFTDDASEGTRVVVNFGIHGGRQATQAELERLGEALIAHVDAVDVVSENRYRFDLERSASVHQVLIETSSGSSGLREELVATAEAWAEDCLRERRLSTP